MSDLQKMPLPGEKYKHYKGGTYDVITLATHSETQEKMVVYQSVNFGSIFVRPLSMWNDDVQNPESGATIIKRFTKI